MCWQTATIPVEIRELPTVVKTQPSATVTSDHLQTATSMPVQVEVHEPSTVSIGLPPLNSIVRDPRRNERVRSRFGRQMKSKRQSTVEPVWGTLTQFMGLRKINTKGLKQANKVMHLAATAYNLKKLLKFITTKVEPGVGVMAPGLALKSAFLLLFGPCLRPVTVQN